MSRNDYIRRIFAHYGNNYLSAGTVRGSWYTDKRWEALNLKQVKDLYRSVPIVQRLIWSVKGPYKKDKV